MALAVATSRSRSDVGGRRFALLIGLLVVTLAALAWTVSFPGPPFGWAGLALLGGVFSLVLAVRLLRRRENRIHPAVVVGVLGVATALALSILTSSTPATLRFEASRPALEAVVAGHDPLPASSFPEQSWNGGSGEPSFADRATFTRFPGECPAAIGAYAIVECRAFEGGFLFLQQENAITDDSGIAWLPEGLRPQRPDGQGLSPSGFTHLDGPWYAWSCFC